MHALNFCVDFRNTSQIVVPRLLFKTKKTLKISSSNVIACVMLIAQYLLLLCFQVKSHAVKIIASMKLFRSFKQTIKVVVSMWLQGRELSIAEKTNYLVFMINAFQVGDCY